MSMKQFPTLVGIGGSFSGWSELKQLLTEHPQITDELPRMDFFAGKHWQSKDTDWYLAGIGHTPKEVTVTGELSVGYLYQPAVPERLVRTFPDSKLLAVVRHPLARAIAEYQYYLTLPNRRQYASCHEFLLANQGVVERGRFGATLSRYFHYYSPLELQVVVYDELVETPLAVAERLYRWLEVDPTFVPERLYGYVPPEEPPLNPSKLKKLRLAIKHKLIKRQQAKLEPWQPPQPNLRQWFTPEEEAHWVEVYWSDVVTLSDLLYEDMTVRWFPTYRE